MSDSQPWIRLLAVCLGGAVGSGARYLVSGWALRVLGPMFAWGTLVVNLAGSFLLGFMMLLALETDLIPPVWRLALTVGALGGFTTYSTFNYETIEYLREEAWLLAGANVLATLAGCLAAGFAGLALARWIFK